MAKKGIKFTQEHKDKIKKKLIGNKNGKGNKGILKPKSKEWKEKMKGKIAWNKGLTKETDERVKGYGLNGSKSRMGKYYGGGFKKGLIPWNKGLPGNKQPNWQGGISFEPYSVDWTETLKRSIRERDNYICQLCSKYGNTVHHIDYNKKNCNCNNLITLCVSCNAKVNFNRDQWKEFFSFLIISKT